MSVSSVDVAGTGAGVTYWLTSNSWTLLAPPSKTPYHPVNFPALAGVESARTAAAPSRAAAPLFMMTPQPQFCGASEGFPTRLRKRRLPCFGGVLKPPPTSRETLAQPANMGTTRVV